MPALVDVAKVLSTVSKKWGGNVGYPPLPKDNPWVIWAEKSASNYGYLRSMASNLDIEYRMRKNIMENTEVFSMIQCITPPHLPFAGLYRMPQDMPDKFKKVDVVESYRDFYVATFKGKVTYSKRTEPFWLSYEGD
jgi:hypothetical protein